MLVEAVCMMLAMIESFTTYSRDRNDGLKLLQEVMMKAGRIIEENQGIEEPRTKFEDDIPPSDEDYIDDEWLAGVSHSIICCPPRKSFMFDLRLIGPGIAWPLSSRQSCQLHCALPLSQDWGSAERPATF